MQDKTYGQRVADSHELQLTVADAKLVWLELASCPALRMLTLKADAQGGKHERHLTLSAVPQLQRIENPHELPLVVHLDARDRTQPLLIEGPVKQVDFCWEHGEYANTRMHRQVLLLPVEQLSQYRQEVEQLRMDALLVLYRSQHDASNNPSCNILQLKTDARVDIQGLPELQQLHVTPARQQVQVTVRNSRRLELVNLRCESKSGTSSKPSNHRVTISDCGRTRLKFTGPWQRIELVGCGIHRLSVEQALELYVRGLCYIEETHVPNTMRVVNQATNWFAEGVIPDINESTLRELSARLSSNQQDAELIATCLAAVRRCERPKSRYHGIHILSLLAMHLPTAYIDELLEVRKGLVPPNTTRPYPEDLHLEAWRADVNIWHQLRSKANKAGLVRIDNFYGDVFMSSGQPSSSGYALLAECLDIESYDLLERALRKLMPDEPQQSRRRQYDDRFWRNGQYVKGLKRLVLSIPRLPTKLKALAIEFVLLSLANDMLQVAAQKLLQQEPALTRRLALRIANRHVETRESYLRLALSAALPAPTAQPSAPQLLQLDTEGELA